MTYLFTTILVMASIFSVYSASITGKLVSQLDDTPLAFANVYIDDLHGTYSQENGAFEISNLEIGNYKLQIQYLGYSNYTANINITSNTQVLDQGTISMEMSSTLIDEVLIVQPVNNFSSKYVGTNNLISNKTIEKINPVGSEELLKSIPGVNVSGDFGISNRLNVGIRGSYPRRSEKLLILEDGTPIAPATYLSPAAYYNPPTERLDGIEIYKGTDVLSYGGSSMYGVINYITKAPPSQPQLTFNTSGGSNGLNAQYLTYGGTWNQTSAEVQLLHKYFGGYQANSQSRIFNGTIKLHSQLKEDQGIYIKMNIHNENSKATYSGITPFTFENDAGQNPFDSDDLKTNRLALDLVHSKSFVKKVKVNSKVYLHQFTRDWWRQNTTVIKASNVADYLGDEILSNRYSYLNKSDITNNDYVRVGRLEDDSESTLARNRIFKVAGVNETIEWKKEAEVDNVLKVSLQYHYENFANQEIENNLSRFARSGAIKTDKIYQLHSTSLSVEDKVTWKKFQLKPILRLEWIKMSSVDLVDNANQSQQSGDKNFGKDFNSFLNFLPGINLSYDAIVGKHDLKLYTGFFRGFNPPTSSFGFLTVSEGSVSKPDETKNINIKSEHSLNFEIGMRGQLFDDLIAYQSSYFNNHISNFYAAGRKEAFESLGKVNIQGLEVGIILRPLENNTNNDHQLSVGLNLTYLKSKIQEGKIIDSDFVKAKHTEESIEEFLNLVQKNSAGLILENADGVIDNTELNENNFSDLTKVTSIFGEGALSNNSVPYAPNITFSANFDYQFKGFSMGITSNFVNEQFTDYLNFENETAEGAIGKLNAYLTVDANVSYEFNFKNKRFHDLEIYLSGKNLTNKIYRASRLHRVSSGIIAAGFRQINGGVRMTVF